MTISVVPMSESDFIPYMQHSAQEYAHEKVRSGAWTEAEALSNARAEISRLLPAGYHTPNHHFLSLLHESGSKVGLFWLYVLPSRQEAFIYDFEIFTPFRGRGLGQQAMQTLFSFCRMHGLAKISLHVFAHNTRASHVYQKLGFRATDISMSKKL